MDRGLILLALPAVLYILVFNYIPLYGLALPFVDFHVGNSLLANAWVGLSNFRFLFMSDQVWRATFNTLGYNALFIFLGTFVSVAAALMLFELKRAAIRIYQTVMFFPFFLSWVVVAYLSLTLLDVQYGMLNKVLQAFGSPPVFWYTRPDAWPFIIVIAAIWKGLGSGAVVYYAGLVAINPEYYEAARIDGATKLQQVRLISLPLLRPLMVMLILLGLGRVFYSDFGLFYNLPFNQPYLYAATDVIDTYVFRILRVMGNINQSAAANFYQSVMGFILILSANWLIREYDRDLALF